MAIDTTYFARDLVGVIADLPTVAKYGATTFDVAASALTQDQVLLLTGNQALEGAMIVFNVAAIAGEAALKEQARIDLKFPNPAAFTHYQVARIEVSPDALSYNVTLMQDKRN